MQKEKKLMFIIDTFATILSLFAIFFLILDTIHIFPLVHAMKYDAVQLELVLNKTQIGKVILHINATEESDIWTMISQALLSFIQNAHFMNVVFLIFFIFLLAISFYKENWQYVSIIRFYLKLDLFIIICYLLKFLLSAAFFGILYQGDTISYYRAFVSIPYVHFVVHFLLIFAFLVFILRYIFQFLPLLKKKENL